MSEQPKIAKSKSIKDLKPNPRSHYDQGYFDVSKSKKYKGSGPVIYRSGLEKSWFNVFERSDSIIEWSSEPPEIDIRYMYGDKLRKYNIDCYVKYASGAMHLIEIKPAAQTQEPQLSKYRGNKDRFTKDLETFQRNYAKWEAAHNWCVANNMVFKILTEVMLKRITG